MGKRGKTCPFAQEYLSEHESQQVEYRPVLAKVTLGVKLSKKKEKEESPTYL